MSFAERISLLIKKPLKPSHAIILAVASLWLLGGICTFLVIHYGKFRFSFWDFKEVSVDDIFIKVQVITFYMAYFAAGILPSSLAGNIIAKSTFKRPLTVSFFTAFGFYALIFVIKILRWPWANTPAVAQTTALYGELVTSFLLICIMVFSAWLVIGPVWKFLNSLRTYQVILITTVFCILVIIGAIFVGENIGQIIQYFIAQ